MKVYDEDVGLDPLGDVDALSTGEGGATTTI